MSKCTITNTTTLQKALSLGFVPTTKPGVYCTVGDGIKKQDGSGTFCVTSKWIEQEVPVQACIKDYKDVYVCGKATDNNKDAINHCKHADDYWGGFE